jgi:ADP-ribosylglycohydrolase
MAGAAGDALGAPVEFMDRPEILRRFGPEGIRDYAPAYGGVGRITDDTQMTLFTAEGLLQAIVAGWRAPVDVTEPMRRAYLRWLLTQNMESEHAVDESGWLLTHKELFSRRAPGNTCLSALRRKGGERNDSKGCGGIMRVAPCGIFHAGDAASAYDVGLMAAKLTHGHPTGYLSAAVFAAIVANLMMGMPLSETIAQARRLLLKSPQHEETLAALDSAAAAAASNEPAEKAIAALGEGWVAEEALAIGVYCALAAPTLEEGIVMAVNITGDSDSTGAIAGNLLGAMHGASAIPARWLAPLELESVIEQVGQDLVTVHTNFAAEADQALRLRYARY